MADNLDTPYSRREIFYKGILDQDPDSLPDPETREERYLKAIAEAYPTPVEATVTQDEGSSTTSVMSQKSVTDALDGLRDSKLDKTGTAPHADNLTPYSADSGATQSVPFINQGTGCGNGESVIDTGSYAQVKKKLGNTVCVNQLVGSLGSVGVTQNCNKSYDSGTGVATFTPTNYASNNVGVYGIGSAIVGRKYLISMQIKLGKAANVRFAIGGDSATQAVTAGSFILIQRIATATTTGSLAFYVECSDASWTNETFEVRNLFGIDLSLWFGSTASIPSHLLSHPEDFGRYYSGSLAYNPGQLIESDGSVLTSIGRNVWDGENDVIAIPNRAYYCKGTATITYKDRGGNTISTASVTDTSFTTPADCFGFGVSGTGVTISLYYPDESGYSDDYSYTVLAQIDTGSEVLRSAGAVADEKAPDGTITRKVGVVDLGTLTWSYGSPSGSNMPRFYAGVSGLNPPAGVSDYGTGLSCARFIADPSPITTRTKDKTIARYLSRVYINDSGYSSAADFKTAMSGVMLHYELATPTTEQGTPFSGASADNFAIDDFGSMMWTQSNGVPQGVEIFYPYNYKAAVDTLLNMVDGDVEELVTETELGAVADRIPEAPAEDGTYTFKAIVADGVKTYAWVADE